MPGPSVAQSFSWAFGFLGQIFLKWVPATVMTVSGVGTPPPPGPTEPSVSFISTPISAPDALTYLQSATTPGVWDRLYHDWSVFVAVSLFISLLLIALVIYCAIRIFQIRYFERMKFAAIARSVEEHDVPRTQLRWQRISEQMQSDDPQQWRLAILESDIMLNELLDSLGYKGETMADKMKLAERADFRTIDDAWEAHRVRNMIAHQGMHTPLTHHEAQRAVGLYQRVFKEFDFVG